MKVVIEWVEKSEVTGWGRDLCGGKAHERGDGAGACREKPGIRKKPRVVRSPQPRLRRRTEGFALHPEKHSP